MTTRHLVMITGQRRSGTTLVSNLLDGQAGMTVGRDFLGIARLHRQAGKVPLDTVLPFDVRRHVLAVFDRQTRNLDLEPDATSRLLATAPTSAEAWSLAEFYDRVLSGIAASDDVAVGHKTTGGEVVVEALLDAVPRSRVLYMIRDPRDVIVSARVRFPDESLVELIDRWDTGVRRMRDLDRRRPDLTPRIAWVRYEDLVTRPAPTLDPVLESLGLAALEVPDQLRDHGSDWTDNSSYGLTAPGIDVGAVGRRHADPHTARRVEVALGPLIEATGFEAAAPATPIERLRHRLATGGHRVAELGRRARDGAVRRIPHRRSPDLAPSRPHGD